MQARAANLGALGLAQPLLSDDLAFCPVDAGVELADVGMDGVEAFFRFGG